MKHLLKATTILDYQHPAIQHLVQEKQWQTLNEVEKVKQIYHFVRDEIQFGYNASDDLRASQVLKDGYGQCNTKATLLMALLRAVNIPNRLHGFTIDKALQKGAITGLWYQLSPANILHTWVEVYITGKWFHLEGVIVDQAYLHKLQRRHGQQSNTFCGYGVYTDQFLNPPIDWNLNDTYIQDKGINQDFGLFDSPDVFYAQHQQQLSVFQKCIYQYMVRHIMNRNVKKIRQLKCA